MSIVVFRKLLGRETLRLWVRLKPSEKEGIGCVVEEFVLSMAAVLVHGLSYYRKVDQGVLEILVVLVVPMREHKKL